MKRSIAVILCATLPLTFAGCNGTHHSTTDPGTAPKLANLQNPDKVTRVGPQQGTLAISFDFSDPDGDIAFYTLQVSDGQATNPLNEATGRAQGSVTLLQSMHIPSRGTMTYSLQLEDRLGHRSNEVQGSYTVE